ncbi:hypothetical protein ACHAXR_004999, partial [Thalassiosira sp. AJA248-18]
MARNTPSSSSSAPSAGKLPPPREEGRQQNNAAAERSDIPVQSGASPSVRSGSRNDQARGGSGATHHDDSSARSRSSASASRINQSGNYRRDRHDRRSYNSRSRSGDSYGRHSSSDRDSRYYDHNSYHNHNRSSQNYRNDGSWRNNERPHGSSYGRDRDREHWRDDYSRDHHRGRGRYENSHHNNDYARDYSRHDARRHEQGHDYGRDDRFGPIPDYGSAAPRDEYQTHRGERRPDYFDSALAQNEHQSQREADPGRGSYHGSNPNPDYDPTPALNECQSQSQSSKARITLTPPPQEEVLSTERLKEELEREKLETKIALERLERERINCQLSQMKSSDDVTQSENIASSSEIAHTSTKRNNTASINTASTNTASPNQDLMDSDSINNVSANQYLMDSDSVDELIATRKSLKKKGIKRTDKAPRASQKKKTKRRATGGQAKLSANTKRKLREAQRANDEKMKYELLKAYEKDLAALKSKNMHCYTETDLMSSFTPVIIDHHLMDEGYGKFRVKWVPKSNKGKSPTDNNDNHCVSWISHEDFLFPVLARKYLSREIRTKTRNNETDGVKLWMEDCKERERCLNCLNTFDTNDDDFDEIDFCCFLCHCPWDHPFKHSIRNCEEGLKYHRGCCHGYKDEHELESFVSPVGKVQTELLEQLGKEDGGSDDRENETEASVNLGAGRNVDEISQGTKPMAIVDGECDKYVKCLQGPKRDAVVVCINAGVGSSAVALKHLGVKVAKMIHVEADRVAKHVIRFNHDHHYGEIDSDDKIQHIVGLYESLADIAGNPEKLVRTYGPIDIIICTSPQKKTKEDSAQLANDFLSLVNDIERLNAELHHSNHLFYLLESLSCIKDQLPLQGRSYCICEERKELYVCNWPISSQKASLLSYSRITEDSQGLPDDYVLPS